MVKYGKTDKPVQSQVDWDIWDEICEIVYSNMLLQLRILNVEERKEHETDKR